MNEDIPNHPFIVFAVCFLWLFSLISIGWSLLLFVSVSDLLLMTGLDLVNAFVLLSGLVMLPTNVQMLYAIANGIKINYNSKVVCCPLWLSIFWIIIINVVGAVLCIHKIHICPEITTKAIRYSMQHYRNIPKYKSFMDTLQWNLKCCGSDSYKDWFNIDWYDKIQNYEWDPKSKHLVHSDNVPLSCCKSGSCISNYLSELGTCSINTNGCSSLTRRIVLLSMHIQLYMFIIVIILEVLVFRFIVNNEPEEQKNCRSFNVRHIMNAKRNFNPSDCSYQVNLEGCEDNVSRDF